MATAKEMFGESSPKDLAAKSEAFDAALKSATSNPNTDPMFKQKVDAGLPQTFSKNADATEQIAALLSNKSLSADAVASLNNALAAQTADINKDISLTSPLSSSFAAFDLEAPAKYLVPVPTPIRNKLPRTKGVGTAHRIKRITGFTNAITGTSNIHPGITETTQNNFAVNGSANALYLNRGPKISYTADDKTFNYASFGLSDDVTFDAQYSGLGYQDLIATSARTLLYSSMLAEERMMLMGRGTTSNGFSGALAAPTISLTARTAASGEVALGLTDKVYVLVTSDAGSFGQSVLSGSGTALASGTLTSGQVVDVTITSVTGALGYRVYATHAASAPADNTTSYYQGRTATTTFTLQGTLATTGVVASSVVADTSAYAAGYDGILAYCLGSSSGYNNNINTTFSTSNPGVEFQTAFAAMYANNLANPDEIFLNGSDRKQISDSIKNGSTANYRLNLSQNETGDYVGGAVIGALHNEITGKLVDLTVHPYLPQGVAPILSYVLPFENSEVSNLWAAVNVQDYTYLNWPKIQLQNEASTYWRGTFVSYGPSWSGAVSGIKAA
jgi:hypothetical protein